MSQPIRTVNFVFDRPEKRKLVRRRELLPVKIRQILLSDCGEVENISANQGQKREAKMF